MKVYVALMVPFALLAGTEPPNELGCYTFDGRHYRGTLSTTTLGRTCQAWSSQTPHKHLLISANYPDSGMEENYCRNPNGMASMPWCYTTDKKRRWEYCQVPQCAVAEDPELDCYSFDGRRYRGTIHQTINGRACQAWSDMKPHGHSRVKENYPYSGLEENYCRNPDGEQRPWCYTTDPSRRWEFCNVPRCDLRPELACYTLDGRNYRGEVASTSSGRHCQDWAAQRPHEHSRTEIDYPDKGLDQPYCRNPDGAAKPWCYTTDQQRRWEYCEIPRCYVPGVSEADKKTIVDKHNELRRGVQPSARNMLKMEWSEEAAANAQKWADKCTLEHSPKGARKISTSGCGENLFMSSAEKTWDDAIQAWYDEVKDWKYGEGSVNGGVVGHFTQVVWYRSNKVGCAVAHCPNAAYQYFYVCQYCPPGNVGGKEEPYKEGPACGDCPNACDDKLCTNPCPYNDGPSNCPSLKEKWGCSHPTIAGWCPASCKCTTEII